MAKSLKDILAGQKKSKVSPPDINDKNLYQWNSPDGVKFIDKHKIETHDYPHDAEAAFKGKKGGVDKTSKYKFQKDGVYEEASCNHSGKGVHCEMHGDDDCSGSEPKDMPKKGQKVLNDNKKKVAEDVEEISEMPSQHRSAMGHGRDSWAKDKAHKIAYDKPRYYRPSDQASKSDLRSLINKSAEGKKVTKLPAGKAKGLKEEDIQEVAPPNPKIEKWIKANKERFIKEYGKEKGTQVLYAKAWKMHGQSESGSPATNTDYTGPGAAGWTTGRHDVGTL